MTTSTELSRSGSAVAEEHLSRTGEPSRSAHTFANDCIAVSHTDAHVPGPLPGPVSSQSNWKLMLAWLAKRSPVRTLLFLEPVASPSVRNRMPRVAYLRRRHNVAAA